MLHPVGIKVKEYIKYLKYSKEKTIDFDRDHLYHARCIADGEMPFLREEMGRAPIGMPSQGRFNYIGRAFFYCASTQKGARMEVTKHNRKANVQVAKLRPIYTVELLDLSSTLRAGRNFLENMRYKVSDVLRGFPRQYLLPSFVAECCRKGGFDGIKYKTSKEYDNYVLWLIWKSN